MLRRRNHIPESQPKQLQSLENVESERFGQPGFGFLEREKGIEPSFQAWEARVLPLNHSRSGSECSKNSIPAQ
jgi:hypothetical protein